jgi:hypothetical protein
MSEFDAELKELPPEVVTAWFAFGWSISRALLEADGVTTEAGLAKRETFFPSVRLRGLKLMYVDGGPTFAMYETLASAFELLPRALDAQHRATLYNYLKLVAHEEGGMGDPRCVRILQSVWKLLDIKA